MTHDIASPTHYAAGESLRQELTIEEDGTPKDISGATVTWTLLPVQGADADAALLTGADDGVDVTIVDGANGRIDITIDQDVTTDLPGQHYQRLVVDDVGPGKQIWGGQFRILDL